MIHKEMGSEISTVCVLMSAYNGEKYINEQIESIIRQTGVSWTLYIRDDGSKDSTIDIIKKYESKHENIFVSYGNNIGVAKSFMELIYHAPDIYDYYAFADQDDIWDSDKLKAAVDVLSANPKKTLYASNQECVDENGKHIRMRYTESQDIHTDSISVLEQNMLAGCTFVFTKQLKKLLSEVSRRPGDKVLAQRIHDVWVINVAALKEGVIYDPSSYMKYRQHSDNVVGADSFGLLYDIKQKFNKLFNKDDRNGRSLLGAELCRCFPKETDKNEIMQACINAKAMKNKKILLNNIDLLCRYSGETHIGLGLKIMLNLF